MASPASMRDHFFVLCLRHTCNCRLRLRTRSIARKHSCEDYRDVFEKLPPLLLYASPLVGAEKQGALRATMFFEQADLVPPG